MKSPRTEVRRESPFGDSEIAQIRACLDRLLTSGVFGGSARKTQLLRYLVEHALTRQEVSEYAIGLDVFEKPASFDPRIDSAVRAEVSRLRQRLKEYYATSGIADPVVIDLPQRSYIPAFLFRDPEEPDQPAPTKRIPWRVALAALGIAVIGALIFWQRMAGRQSVESLVVLPFANLSGNQANEYLADGLTEELTNELAQRPELRVVARTSAFQFKGKAVDVREIGRRLNVDSVLEGSFDKQGERIRVTAQLNRATNGYHIWSHAFEARSGDMMALQDEMARSIAAAIGGLGRPGQAHAPESTTNPEAHDLYLQANYQRSLYTPEAQRRSLELFQRAVEKDPQYARAYYGIGNEEISLIHFTGEDPKPGFERARAAFRRAIEIDPDFADAHGGLAAVLYDGDWDWPSAERETLAALQNGGHATHSFYGWALATRGRFREAQEQFRIAEDFDPLSLGPRFNQMVAFYLERRYSEAKSVLNGMLQMKPDALDAHAFLGLIGAVEHDCATATREFEWCARTYPMPVSKFGLAVASACRGDQQSTRAYLKEMMAAAGRDYISPYQIALGFAFIHDKTAALEYLARSAQAREGQILYLKYEPVFDEIRADPRYIELERTVGLEPY